MDNVNSWIKVFQLLLEFLIRFLPLLGVVIGVLLTVFFQHRKEKLSLKLQSRNKLVELSFLIPRFALQKVGCVINYYFHRDLWIHTLEEERLHMIHEKRMDICLRAEEKYLQLYEEKMAELFSTITTVQSLIAIDEECAELLNRIYKLELPNIEEPPIWCTTKDQIVTWRHRKVNGLPAYIDRKYRILLHRFLDYIKKHI